MKKNHNAAEVIQAPSFTLNAAGFIGADEFVSISGLTRGAMLTKRSVAPDTLPPPFMTRPLRWRLSTVMEWITEQESKNRAASEALARRQKPSARGIVPRDAVHPKGEPRRSRGRPRLARASATTELTPQN